MGFRVGVLGICVGTLGNCVGTLGNCVGIGPFRVGGEDSPLPTPPAVIRGILDRLLETKLRQWSSDAAEVVTLALGPQTNLVYDFLPLSSSSLFAGNSQGLTSKQIGSFYVRIVADGCLDVSTSIN